MRCQPYFNQVLAHYIGLASEPGWKEYAWHRVNEMAKDEYFKDLPTMLKDEMQRRKNGNKNDAGARV